MNFSLFSRVHPYTPQGAEKDYKNDIGPVTRVNIIVKCFEISFSYGSAIYKTDLLLLLSLSPFS